MIWFRAGLLAILVGVIVASLTQTVWRPAPEQVAPTEPPVSTEAPMPAVRPTRVPLPTLAPETIISHISRDTPVPLAAPTQSASPRVEVVDYGYSPAQLQIPLGTNVTWSNSGEDGHDVNGNGPGGEWRSGPMAPGERYARQFRLPCTYDYVCDFHPEMRGRVVVQP